MDIQIREYTKEDTKEAIRIWNHIVEEGNAFPQMDCLTETTGEEFFLGQSYTGIAVDVDSGRLPACTSCIPIMWEGADISAMPATRSDGTYGAVRLAKSWYATVWNRGRRWGMVSSSLTRWSKAMKPPFICTKSWDLPGLASYHGDS